MLLTSFAVTGFSQTIISFKQSSIDSDYKMINYIETFLKLLGGENFFWCPMKSKLDFKSINYIKRPGNVKKHFAINTTRKVTNIRAIVGFLQRHNSVINDCLVENEKQRVIILLPDCLPG
jgi:phage-related protein